MSKEKNTPAIVMVSGCFDLLHAGHVAFLKQAASYGRLKVAVGSDLNIGKLKGASPMFGQAERIYMVGALQCVDCAFVGSGTGRLDFLPDLDRICPDVFVVNEDGNDAAKEAACRNRGIAYVVLKRTPAEELPARSSSQIKSRMELPYRVCIAGGWLDQPWVSGICPGSVITAKLRPTIRFEDRSGMATSTRKAASKIWNGQIPAGDVEAIARTIFAAENPPGTTAVAGSQDALGIVCPGINRFNYDGNYWPESIQRINDSGTKQWLEKVLHLVPVAPRRAGYDPLLEQNITAAGVRQLAMSADLAWQAIGNRDTAALGRAVSATADAWREILPLTISPTLQNLRKTYRQHAGTSFSGCGGGYLMIVSDKAIDDEVPLAIA